MNSRFLTKTIILLCFFATGATGLAYELIWTRMLILTFGSTQFAITTVLTTFMAGLALGSILFGRVIDRFPYPLIVYGLIELTIGIYCFLTPSIFEGIRSVYLSTFSLYEVSHASFSPFQFSLSFAGIIIPATLMGGTLPILVKYFTETKDKVGLESGVLYSINTLGAVVGCFITGSFLLYLLGVKETLYAAGSVDILVGMLVILLSYTMGARYQPAARSVESMQEARSKEQEEGDKGQEITPVTSQIVLIAFALSGFAALAYEILWTRVLSLIIGSSIYAFTIILATFLIGLSIGSILFSKFVDRKKFSIFWFAILEGVIGLSALVSIFSYRHLPFIFDWMYNSFSQNFWIFLFLQFMISLSIIVIPTLAMGATFPAVSMIYTRSIDKVGTSIGRVYFSNTLGAIAGSFSAGFIMIPLLGIQNSIWVVALLNIFISVILFGLTDVKTPQKAIAIGISVIIPIYLISNLPPWDRGIMTLGPYANLGVEEKLSKSAGTLSGDSLLYYKEGLNAVITVKKRKDELSYQANGKYEARVIGDRPSEAWYLLGHIPMLLSREPENVLLIGLGSGITLGAIEEYPVERIDVVEIEPAVIEASRFFSAVHNNATEDQRVSINITDGRGFVASTNKTYDVIISGVSDPWISGVSNLFTKEYFQDLHNNLSQDGVAAIWFQNYRMSDEDFKVGINTFASVFPYVSIWFHYSLAADLIVIGSKHEALFDIRKMKKQFSSERVKNGLKRIGVADPYDIFEFFLIGNRDLRRYLNGAAINTDNKPILEFSLPRHFYSSSLGSRERVERLFSEVREIVPPVVLATDKRDLEDFYLNLGKVYSLDTFRTTQAIDIFNMVLEINPENTLALKYIHSLKEGG